MMTYYKFSHKCLHGPPNIFRKPWAFAHFLFISGEKLKKKCIPGLVCQEHISFQGVGVRQGQCV